MGQRGTKSRRRPGMDTGGGHTNGKGVRLSLGLTRLRVRHPAWGKGTWSPKSPPLQSATIRVQMFKSADADYSDLTSP